MVIMKKTFSLILVFNIFLFLFAVEPNLILSKSFSNITDFNFDLGHENLTIENIYGDEILVELYSNNNKKLPKVYENEGILILKTKQTKLYPSDYCNIKIYIPYEFVFENVNIQTNSGNIILQDLSSEELSIKSISGKIKSQELKISSYINLYSISGQIDINTVTTETISVQSASGFIYISSIIADYFDTTTDSGIIEISLASQPKASSRIHSKTGEVHLSFQNKSFGFDLIASSTNGIFRDEINNLRLTPRNEYRNSYFGGGPEIQIRTTSGNIFVK